MDMVLLFCYCSFYRPSFSIGSSLSLSLLFSPSYMHGSMISIRVSFSIAFLSSLSSSFSRSLFLSLSLSSILLSFFSLSLPFFACFIFCLLLPYSLLDAEEFSNVNNPLMSIILILTWSTFPLRFFLLASPLFWTSFTSHVNSRAHREINTGREKLTQAERN